jgi:hypothetical protein
MFAKQYGQNLKLVILLRSNQGSLLMSLYLASTAIRIYGKGPEVPQQEVLRVADNFHS